MKYVVFGFILALLIVHQDFWMWDDSRLVFGFMPSGLLYHAGISVAASFAWYLATVYAWPEDLTPVDAPSPSAENNGGEA